MGDQLEPSVPSPQLEPDATFTPGSVEHLTPDPGVEQCVTSAPGSGVTPVTPADLSRLYPPLPRGEFSPSVLPPSSGQSHRDEFFALRPGVLQAAISETERTLGDEDGKVQGAWLLTEVDHWNRESERLVLLTPRVLLVSHYDFVGLSCHLLLRIPLHYIDSITVGPFHFPSTSLSRRCGLGLRLGWDKLREPSFRSRWNPWAQDLPSVILIEHPGVESGHMSPPCTLGSFRTELTRGVGMAHREQPLAGRANGPLLLEKPIQMETVLGLVSSLSNWAQLGYAKPRRLLAF
ncbi:tumor protein p63-regulated gene 1-like protein [Rhinoraja longicauda]